MNKNEVSAAQVLEMTGLSRRRIQELAKAGTFPLPNRAGGRCVWHRADIEGWLLKREAKPEVSRKPTSSRVESDTSLFFEYDSDIPITTLEDALKHADVDLDVWYVQRWECSGWQVGLKLRDFEGGKVVAEKPVVKNLWRVKIYLKRRLPKALQAASDAILARMEKLAPQIVLPKRGPRPYAQTCMLELDLFDVHFGKYAWAPETGQDYDLKIARTLFANAADDLLRMTSQFEINLIVVPIGNDFYHFDNTQYTTTSGTPQDVDGRFEKVFDVGFWALVELIKNCLSVCAVKVLWVPGNHDRLTSYHVTREIGAYFRNCSDLVVDHSPKHRKYVHYGVSLIGYTHGESVPARALPALMASEMRREWGETTCHEWRKGHVHKSKVEMTVPVDTHDGVAIRTLRSLSAIDSYHYRHGHGGPRSAEAYLTCRETGYAGHFVANARS